MLDTQLRDFLLAVSEDLDPGFLFEQVIGQPDPWQVELLHAGDEFILVLASRQVGKSTTIACIVWHMLAQGKFVVLIAPSERQSKELFRKVMTFKHRSHIMAVRSTQTELELSNGGRLRKLSGSASQGDDHDGWSSVSDVLWTRRPSVAPVRSCPPQARVTVRQPGVMVATATDEAATLACRRREGSR